MSALVLTHFWKRDMRSHLQVLRPGRPQEVPQRASNKVVTVSGVKGVVEDAEQNFPGRMFRVTNVRDRIILLKGYGTSRFREREHFGQYRFLSGRRDVDQHEPFMNDVE